MKNIIKKSKKYVIGISYAIYLTLSFIYIAVWMQNVEIRVELWSETATNVLKYVIFSAAISVGFMFFTATQQLIRRLLVKYQTKKPLTILNFVLLGIFEITKISFTVGGLILTILYSNDPPTTFSVVMFVCISVIFLIDVFYFVFEVLHVKNRRAENVPQTTADRENDKEQSKSAIKKSEKPIISVAYAIYIIALLFFTAKWSVGVHSHIPMSELYNNIFVFTVHLLLLGGAFIVFTVMQLVIKRLVTTHPFKRSITLPVFILLAVFEVIKTALSLLAFTYVKSSSTKPTTPFSTIMIILITIIFVLDVFYLVFEIIQTKRIKENYLDSLEETVV